MARGMKRSRLEESVARIAAIGHNRQIWDAAVSIATRLDVTPQEVIEEAHQLHDQARQRGITLVEVVAGEFGMSIEEVLADVSRHRSAIRITA